MVLKSHLVYDSSIHDGVTECLGGVMESVSGFREISCKDGRTMIRSSGLRLSRSWNDPAMVEIALRSDEDTRMDFGAPWSFRRILRIRFSSASIDVPFTSGFLRRKAQSVSTCERPR